MRAGVFRWPLPALLGWALAWAGFIGARSVGVPVPLGLVLGTVLGLVVSVWGTHPWRRAMIAGGFPLSALLVSLAGGVHLPAWAWLAPLALLGLLYPLNAWRDAPLFPTPPGALAGLAEVVPLGPGAQVLEAGCGLGDGLRELRTQYPQARLVGLEWSWPLVLACRRRCPFADVRRDDLWRADWSGYDLVYLFQRPETMPRALDKARRELAPGRWLVSLEFDVPGLTATARLEPVAGKPVWVYRMPQAGVPAGA